DDRMGGLACEATGVPRATHRAGQHQRKPLFLQPAREQLGLPFAPRRERDVGSPGVLTVETPSRLAMPYQPNLEGHRYLVLRNEPAPRNERLGFLRSPGAGLVGEDRGARLDRRIDDPPRFLDVILAREAKGQSLHGIAEQLFVG